MGHWNMINWTIKGSHKSCPPPCAPHRNSEEELVSLICRKDFAAAAADNDVFRIDWCHFKAELSGNGCSISTGALKNLSISFSNFRGVKFLSMAGRQSLLLLLLPTVQSLSFSNFNHSSLSSCLSSGLETWTRPSFFFFFFYVLINYSS